MSEINLQLKNFLLYANWTSLETSELKKLIAKKLMKLQGSELIEINIFMKIQTLNLN